VTRFRSDEGVFAILYGLLIVVLIGMCAVVVDLSMLRADKRDARTAADTASLAGAADLGNGPYNPRKACTTAWTNTWQSLNLGIPGTNPCGGYGTNIFPCPSSATQVSQVVAPYTWRFTWPVPDTSTLLTQPDGLTSGARSVDTAFDGTDPCWRVGVQLVHQRQLGLASLLGVTSGVSSGTSVALYTFSTGPGTYNYPLVVLNQHECNVLTTSGSSSSILVTTSASDPNVPGRIAIDSDGADPGSSCNGGKTILLVNGSSGFIQAEDGADASTNPVDKNSIEIFNGSGTAIPSDSYTGVSTPCTPTNSATPTNTPCVANVIRRPQRVTRSPFDATFKPAVTQLDTAYSSGMPAGWYSLTGDACKSDFKGTAAMGSGFYVDCSSTSGFTGLVSNWTFPKGAPVIVNGDLQLKNGGCFATNVDPAYVGACTAYAPTDAQLTANSIVLVRGNIDSSGSTGVLILPGTFLNQVGTVSNANPFFNGSNFGTLFWTAPYGDQATMDTACKTALAASTTAAPPVDCFRNLAYWTETTSLANVQGGANLTLEGTFFLGRAPLKVGGNGTINVANSQFVALTITTAGTKTLVFTPNPTRTTPISRTGVSLIR
jgi:Flp pilus assembly protein TadG